MGLLILHCLPEVLLRLVSGDSREIKPIVDAILMFALDARLVLNVQHQYSSCERVFLEVCASSNFSPGQVKEKFQVQQILYSDTYL